MKKKRVQKDQIVISFRSDTDRKQFIIDYVKSQNTDIKQLFTDYIDYLRIQQKPLNIFDNIDDLLA